MAGLTFVQVYPDLEEARHKIQNYLDQPAQEYLKEETIDQILERSYNTVFFQTTIEVANETQIKDIIDAITVWHCYGAYINSMADNLQDSAKFEFMNKLKHYKEIAIGLGNLIGIDVKGDRIPIDSTQIVAGGVGMSVYKDTTYYEGAADNVNS
jgi:hypothetical protein